MDLQKVQATHTLYNLENLIKFRQDIHQNPELGFQEFETQKKIKQFLLNIGVKEQNIHTTATTGLIVDLIGTGKQSSDNINRCIAYRADIDALDMFEENKDLQYKSTKKGAHMCGHDGHITCLLGFACLFMENAHKFPNNRKVRLLFQPCEEGKQVNGKVIGGAEQIIKEGFLKGVDEVYGYHNQPLHKFGEIVILDNAMMSEVKFVEVKIIGKGGHGSMPQLTIDPQQALIDILQYKRDLMTSYEKQNYYFGFSLPMIVTGDRYNVIPDEIVVKGTFRSFSDELSKKFDKEFTENVVAIGQKWKCKCQVTLQNVYPVLLNTKKEAGYLVESAKKIFKEENILTNEKPFMASEDFAYYTQVVPGAFFFLGNTKQENSNEGIRMLHSTTYNFNDDLIDLASKFYMQVAEDRLINYKKE